MKHLHRCVEAPGVTDGAWCCVYTTTAAAATTTTRPTIARERQRDCTVERRYVGEVCVCVCVCICVSAIIALISLPSHDRCREHRALQQQQQRDDSCCCSRIKLHIIAASLFFHFRVHAAMSDVATVAIFHSRICADEKCSDRWMSWMLIDMFVAYYDLFGEASLAAQRRGRTQWPNNTALYDSVIVDSNAFKLYLFILLMT